MPTYTFDQLKKDGPPFAMAMLLKCLNSGEPFVTYGAIGDELEHQFGVETIFPTSIGHVAGSLMNQILKVDPTAPLINTLITQPNGLPGKGAGPYFAKRYKNPRYENWEKLPTSLKRKSELAHNLTSRTVDPVGPNHDYEIIKIVGTGNEVPGAFQA